MLVKFQKSVCLLKLKIVPNQKTKRNKEKAYMLNYVHMGHCPGNFSVCVMGANGYYGHFRKSVETYL